MNPLSIKNAIQLYRTLAIHLPESSEEPLKFISEIITSIQDKNRHTDYIQALALMLDVPDDTILENLTPEESINVFTEGLMVNRIMALRDFCVKLGL